MRSALIGVFSLLVLAAGPGARGSGVKGDSRPPDASPARTHPHAVRGPLLFEENGGQVDATVAFFVRGGDRTVFFGADGITHSIGTGEQRWAVKARFPGARRARPVGGLAAETTVSCFRGPRARWRTGLRTFSEIAYPDLWPGIDLRVIARECELESVWIVHPGADASRIRFRYEGADVACAEGGAITVLTPRGGFSESAPVAFADREIPAAYEIRGGEVSFALGAHDPSRGLVIDPAQVLYSGFIGGTDPDEIMGVATDGLGNAYVVGSTSSATPVFPVQAGPFLAPAGHYDAFVAKLSPDGSAFSYCGYLGGAREDRGFGITVDPNGAACIVGRTRSDETTFPVLNGPDLTFNGIETAPGAFDSDAFIAKVSPAGTALVFCGYIGGNQDDTAKAVALDALGDLFVTGTTSSTEATFPVLVGPDLTHNGASDAFIAKVYPGGLSLGWCGYVGGSLAEYGNGVAADAVGNAWLAGHTMSTEATFPVASGFDVSHNGGWDAFVAKVSLSGTSLAFATYVGGSGTDLGTDLAVDILGQCHIVGETSSDESTFPVTTGPDLVFNVPYGSGPGDPTTGSEAWIAKLSSTGVTLRYAGYLGGRRDDFALGVAVDVDGSALVTGGSRSRDSAAPDAFLARVSPAGTSMPFGVFLGTRNTVGDQGNDVAVAQNGSVFVAGSSASTGTGIPSIVGPGPRPSGNLDGFVYATRDLVVDLDVLKGSLKDGPRPGKDAARVSASIGLPPKVGWMIDPVAEGVTVTLGDLATPFVLEIPPGSAGWKILGGRLAWKGAGGRVTIDVSKKTFDATFGGFDFPGPQANPIQLVLRSGGLLIADATLWTEKPRVPGSFRYP